MINKITVTLGLILFSVAIFAQSAPFNIALEPVSIAGLGGLQSFAYAQHNGKWLLVAGRLDGLHRRQPWAAFDVAGHNNELIVVDPVSLQKWSSPLTSLPIAIQEQLSSTNMNFYQEGDYLYFIGGYGYSATENDHTTFPNLTAIKVSDVINAIITNTSVTPFFRQITDPKFQVTGGKLQKIYDTYYLLGGQKFIGRYNPMGPGHGPGFVQEYTNAIRPFTIFDNGSTLIVNHLSSSVDSANLHRRDYNAEPQILPTGEEGITMFSGVFQTIVDLPFLNSVTVDSSTYTVNNTFQQYYNHYHCAALPLYSENANEMHTVFFGGIAQFYDSAGVLVQDNNIPFIKTIARVTRNGSGNMAEYKLPIEMPALLGTGSEFIPNKNIPHFNNDVFKLDQITADSTLVGYIFGGISSTAANIFFVNSGTQSSATSQIFKVYLTNNNPLAVHNLNEQSNGTLNLTVYPNPNDGNFIINYNLLENKDVKLTFSDLNGKIVDTKVLTKQTIGKNTFTCKMENLNKIGIYFITIESSYEKATQKIIIDN